MVRLWLAVLLGVFAVDGQAINCTKGKPCGGACIAVDKVCRVDQGGNYKDGGNRRLSSPAINYREVVFVSRSPYSGFLTISSRPPDDYLGHLSYFDVVAVSDGVAIDYQQGVGLHQAAVDRLAAAEKERELARIQAERCDRIGAAGVVSVGMSEHDLFCAWTIPDSVVKSETLESIRLVVRNGNNVVIVNNGVVVEVTQSIGR